MTVKYVLVYKWGNFKLDRGNIVNMPYAMKYFIISRVTWNEIKHSVLLGPSGELLESRKDSKDIQSELWLPNNIIFTLPLAKAYTTKWVTLFMNFCLKPTNSTKDIQLSDEWKDNFVSMFGVW